MIKKIILGVVLTLLFVGSTEALTFKVERNRYYGFSRSDFYHRTYVRPLYMAPTYVRPRGFAPQYIPPYVNPYYSPTVPYYTVPTTPRGYHFRRRAYR